jgi:hypothetical protein
MNVYLWTGLVISLAGVLCLAAFPRHRSLAMLSGVCTAPVGLFDTLFTPDYWDPPHLLGKWLSVEGFFLSFGNGIFMWLAAAIPLGSMIDYKLDPSRFCRRYLGCLVIAIAAFATLWRGGLAFVDLPVMDAYLIATVILAAFILGRRLDAWPFAVTGSIGFSIVYAVQLFAVSYLVPEPAQYWSPAVRAGILVFGLPVEEMVWAFVFGAVMPLALAYCSDVRLGGPASKLTPLF